MWPPASCSEPTPWSSSAKTEVPNGSIARCFPRHRPRRRRPVHPRPTRRLPHPVRLRRCRLQILHPRPHRPRLPHPRHHRLRPFLHRRRRPPPRSHPHHRRRPPIRHRRLRLPSRRRPRPRRPRRPCHRRAWRCTRYRFATPPVRTCPRTIYVHILADRFLAAATRFASLSASMPSLVISCRMPLPDFWYRYTLVPMR